MAERTWKPRMASLICVNGARNQADELNRRNAGARECMLAIRPVSFGF
jgi:hypothetical protein